jgi:5'-nucleotidase (lipoprotein e(P4) family)
MRSKRNYIYAFALVLCTSAATYFVGGTDAQTGARPAVAADNEYQAGALLWMQKSAEYRALAYQAYNIAHLRLDQDLDGKNKKEIPKPDRKKPRAIVVDIDETVLDNSPYQALNVSMRRSYERNNWYEWTKLRKAKPVPGAVDFLNYAVSKGVKVFFISNRDQPYEQENTVENLRSAGFRDISNENVLLRPFDAQGKPMSPKAPRRDLVTQKYRIVLLMGDNLDDFSDVFERKSMLDRYSVTDQNRELWGKKWVVLPNAMYGTWESAMYEYKNLSDAEKTKARANALELP